MSWQKIKLGDILIRRKTSEKIHAEKTYKLVTIKLYHKGVTLRKEVKGDTLKSAMFAVKAGDFILSGIDARNGAFGIVPNELDGAVVTNDFWCLELNTKLIDKEFLLYLTTTDFFDYICKQSSDGTTQRIRLQKDKFFSYEINLPSINEQKDILVKLQKLSTFNHALIAEQASQFTHLALLRQQILSNAIQNKLDIPHANGESGAELLLRIKTEKAKTTKKAKPLPEIKDDDIPFTIPKHWVWCHLNDVCEAIVDCPHSTPKYTDMPTDCFAIDTNCINESGELTRLRGLSQESFDERIKRLVPKENDIIYTREGSIGLATFVPANTKICLGQRVMLFRPSFGVIPEFLKFLVTEETYKNRLLAKHRGMGAKHVNVKDIVQSLIPLPPLEEQTAIIQKVETLLAMCNELENSIRQNQEYTQMLYQTALREALQQPA